MRPVDLMRAIRRQISEAVQALLRGDCAMKYRALTSSSLEMLCELYSMQMADLVQSVIERNVRPGMEDAFLEVIRFNGRGRVSGNSEKLSELKDVPDRGLLYLACETFANVAIATPEMVVYMHYYLATMSPEIVRENLLLPGANHTTALREMKMRMRHARRGNSEAIARDVLTLVVASGMR